MSAAAPPNPAGKKASDPKTIRDWLDTGIKLVAALAGIFAIWVANSFQASLSTTNLVNQREEAESSLRATMFGNLIRQLINNAGDGPSVDQELLLAELLALNFHENFEFKPLLVHLQDRLNNDQSISDKKNKKFELTSIARRVVQRQESLVTRLDQTGSRGRTAERGACLTHIIALAKKQKNTRPDPNKPDEMAKPTDAKCSDTIILREAASDVRTILSPDKKTSVQVDIQSVDWDKEQVEVRLSIASTANAAAGNNAAASFDFSDFFNSPQGRNYQGDIRTLIYQNSDRLQYQKNRTETEQAQLKTVLTGRETLERSFNLTWFDFPMTDYTLLEDGTRFALYIDEIVSRNSKSAKDPQFVRIKLLWFPRDFFSPRERPTSYQAYRKKPWEEQ